MLFRKYDLELKPYKLFSRVLDEIEEFHSIYKSEHRFNFKKFINPFLDVEITHEMMVTYLEYLLCEAEKGTEESPIMSAASTWRKISPLFNKLYSYAGLDGISHKLFDTYYHPHFNRISYGPPIKNFKKLLTLAKSKIVDFTYLKNTNADIHSDSKEIRLITKGSSDKFSHFIDARIPKNPYYKQSLFSNLRQNGLVDWFVNDTYTVNCPLINHKGNPIDVNGGIRKNITIYGTPTEGITYDNDTLSRSRNNFASLWAENVVHQIRQIKGNYSKAS